MNLVLDIGNTNVKAAVFEGNSIIKQKTVSLGDLGNVIDQYIDQYAPKHLIASSVSATEEELSTLIGERLPWFLFKSNQSLPISVEYNSIETLGTDRIAGVMAAFGEYSNKNTLVIDAGTCITYDLLTNDNRYFGGAISPGVELRYKSLHTFTKSLPQLSAKNNPSLIGQTTDESMHSGVLNGIVFEINGVINAYKERFGNLVVLVTGGDSKYFAKELKNTIFADQNLVLKGLNKILEYHFQSA